MAQDVIVEGVHGIFPRDLSPTRYIVFDFYAPDLMNDIVDGLGNMFNTGVSAFSGDIKVKDMFGKLGNEIVSVGGTVYDKVKSNLDKRVIAKEGKVQFDVTATAIDKNSKSYRGSIYLPLTNQLTESISHNYSTQQGGISNLLSSMTGGPEGTPQKTIDGIANFTGSRTMLINPDFVQTYKGANLRSLSLSWSLVPKNIPEAKQIFDIIRTFKMISSPELAAAKALLVAPYFCDVTFNNPKLDDAMRFDEMVIENIDVNYSETGFMETYHDGIPKTLNLSISLLERRIKTHEDWYENSGRKNRKEYITGIST